jgi:hypothetical protein
MTFIKSTFIKITIVKHLFARAFEHDYLFSLQIYSYIDYAIIYELIPIYTLHFN